MMYHKCYILDSKVHGANMGPIWGRQVPGGPRIGPMNIAIWDWFGLWPARRHIAIDYLVQ